MPELLSAAGIGAVLAYGLLAAALVLSMIALACRHPAAPARPLALVGLLPAWLAAEATAERAVSATAEAILLALAAAALIGLVALALLARAASVARAAMIDPDAARAIGLPTVAVGRGALVLALAASLGAGAVGGLVAADDLAPAWCLAAAPLVALAPARPLWAAVALAAGGALLGLALATIAPEDLGPLLPPAAVAALAWLAIGLRRRAAPGHA